jgi:hypothetical protein
VSALRRKRFVFHQPVRRAGSADALGGSWGGTYTLPNTDLFFGVPSEIRKCEYACRMHSYPYGWDEGIFVDLMGAKG